MVKHLLSVNPEEALASRILEDFQTYMRGFVSLPINLPGTAYAKAVKVPINVYVTAAVTCISLICAKKSYILIVSQKNNTLFCIQSIRLERGFLRASRRLWKEGENGEAESLKN